jgi:hypothetical protein
MTELEEKAGRAWALVSSWAMPPAIALGFVEEATEPVHDVPRALDALLTAAVCATANARPTAAAGTFADYEAGAIGAALLVRDCDKAARLREQLVDRLGRMERNRTGDPTFLADWMDWCAACLRAIDLCRALLAAANPAGGRA